jgi:predicted ATP-dependent serine protease
MARKKTEVDKIDYNQMDLASEDLTQKLGEAFEKIIENEYGHLKAPEPLVTPFGIQHLDALLGGGILSSDPVLFSSTPETGKSTLAFQFSSVFQKIYPNSVCVYIDVEGSGNQKSNDFRQSRIEIFGLDQKRFKYEPIVLNVDGVFQLIDRLVKIKNTFEEKLNQEFYIAIIWD